MPIVTKKMPAFDGVAAGQTATCRLPIGLSYHDLMLDYSGVTLSQMTEIRLMANGKAIQRYVGGDVLDMMNQFEGRDAASGTLIVPIGDRFGLNTRQAIEATKLGTGGRMPDGSPDPDPIVSLALEIDIASAATAPALSLIARQSDPDVAGTVKHIHHFIRTPTGAGEFQIADLPTGRVYEKIYFRSSVVTRVVIERDGFVIFDRTAAQNEHYQTDGVRVPQSNVFVVDFSEMGYGTEGLVTAGVQDLRFRLTCSGAGTINIETETFGPLSA